MEMEVEIPALAVSSQRYTFHHITHYATASPKQGLESWGGNFF